MVVPAFSHQRETTNFILKKKRVLITSDPGTGKTRAVLDAFVKLLEKDPTERMLVIAPLSILQASWEEDILKFTPDLTYSIAYSKNREEAFETDNHITITNHDAVKWLQKNPEYAESFSVHS